MGAAHLAVVRSRAQVGVEAPPVEVEVHVAGGLSRFAIVGLPETVVKEARDRVRSAIQTSHFQFPNGRITVNLAPAELPKYGGRFDLPIAIGILAAVGAVPMEALAQVELIGELGLTGELRPVTGALPAALRCRDDERALIVPEANAREAATVRDASVLPAPSLLSVTAHLCARAPLAPAPPAPPPATDQGHPDLADVVGQYQAKRALEIAAAGGHSLLMIGPPGTGKSMLAHRLPGLLPPMSEDDALEAAAVRSVTGGFDPAEWAIRAFRAPHHSASAAALVGGGSRPRPGEISLAHRGVLFLDELPEFDRNALESLREPLETGAVIVSRAAFQARFPACFQLVAAMNPCPCGYLGDGTDRCGCSPELVRRYRGRISGPLLDRIDLHIEVARQPRNVEESGGADDPDTETSADVRRRALNALERQRARFGKPAAALSAAEVAEHCLLGPAERRLLDRAVDRLGFSERSRQRVIRVARTVADLEGAVAIGERHLYEVLSYRCLDRAVSR